MAESLVISQIGASDSDKSVQVTVVSYPSQSWGGTKLTTPDNVICAIVSVSDSNSDKAPLVLVLPDGVVKESYYTSSSAPMIRASLVNTTLTIEKAQTSGGNNCGLDIVYFR